MARKKVYRYSADVARENGELDLFRESGKTNRACAQAIDKAVQESNYKLYHYDLPTAAKKVMGAFGAERVQWVLARALQNSKWDGRYSDNNKEWAASFPLPTIQYADAVINTHPAILDGFVSQVRSMIMEKAIQPGDAQGEYKYYALSRPIDIGTLPSRPKPVKINNFNSKIYVENSTFTAWGCAYYDRPLSDALVRKYELRAAATNPVVAKGAEEKKSVLDSLKEAHPTPDEPDGKAKEANLHADKGR